MAAKIKNETFKKSLAGESVSPGAASCVITGTVNSDPAGVIYMSISKKIRFEVFKRDGFKCQYCGQTPPAITLEVDHINPVSKGGEDDINNLITSCFDCNRGKSNIELKRIPNSLQENKEVLEEREAQYLEYHKLFAKINKRIDKEVNQVVELFESFYAEKTIQQQFKKGTIKPFIEKLNVFIVFEAMELACSKFPDGKRTWNHGRGWWNPEDAALKYFCGICWNKIKGKGRSDE
jgi:hypothetical protein